MFIFSKRFTKMLASTVKTYSLSDNNIGKKMLELYDFYEGKHNKNCVSEKCLLYRLILEKKFQNDKEALEHFSKKSIFKIYLKGNPYGLCCELLSNTKENSHISGKVRILKIIKNDCSFNHCDILKGNSDENSDKGH